MKTVKDSPWRNFINNPTSGGTKTLRVEDHVTLVASVYPYGGWFLVINNQLMASGQCRGWFKVFRGKRLAMFAVMAWLGCHGYNLEA